MKTKRVLKVAAITTVVAGLLFVLTMPLWANFSYKNVKATLAEINTEGASANVPEEVENLIEKELIAPLRIKYYGKDDDSKDRMMSRCPSGVHANFLSGVADKEGYYMGIVNKWVGCGRKEVCKFRASKTKVEVEDGAGYIAAEAWLKKPMAQQKSKKEI